MSRLLCTCLCVALLRGQDAAHLSIDVRRVQVEAQVRDREKAVLGLTQKDFLLLDEGNEQRILHFGAADRPLDLMLLLDVSASMDRLLEALKGRAAASLVQLRPSDRVGIMTFSGEHHLVLPPTFAHDVVASELQYLYVRGIGTELYGNVVETARYLKRVARPGARRAILMISDNAGRRRISRQQALDELWESDVMLSGIFYPLGHQNYLADCRPLIDQTGGMVLFPGRMDVPLWEMFAKLREGYELTYAAPEAAAGSRRRIEIRIRPQADEPERKRWRVRARSGYIVPRNASAVPN
jgi:VWFA-related protein